jgi:hypothetical protein
MSQPDAPDDDRPTAPDVDLLKTAAQAFTGLPPLLAYGGLMAVLIIFGLTLFGVIPDALLLDTGDRHCRLPHLRLHAV